MDVGGMVDLIFGITIVGVLASLLIPIFIIGMFVWVVRRSMFPRRDPAESELRARLARGEIDLAEFQVRLRALRDHGDQ